MSDPETPLRARGYHTLTFDCYGTLVNWEAGLVDFLQPLLRDHDVHVIDEWALSFFAEQEPLAQSQGGSYREVLARVLRAFGQRLAFTPSEEAQAAFGDSVTRWQPFEDTVPALERLAEHYKLAVISNIDNELFAATAERLKVTWDAIITAEDVGAYKPDRAMFDAALARVQAPVLHVAQSRFHDIQPARALGLDAVWINRAGAAAARDAEAAPTATFGDLAALADALC